MAKNLAREVLHATFFMSRGYADIPQAIAGRIDYLHQMLGLQKREALFGEEHPVCKEYPEPGGGALLRFFPKGGNDGRTIINIHGAESALFVKALGKPQLFSSPGLSATDFVLLLFLQVCSGGGSFRAFTKHPSTMTLAKRNTTRTTTSRPTSTSSLQRCTTSSSAVFPRWA